ncbi:hypothetical protein [Candidatus Entotheonella palauensis]|uniref:hypothetical protein n=1 Tax=Candidatus Entotheonella palauensis TaxID=93172 RepID=UPI000B7D005E|nr:hypothetical protein [Candidatus Entotheonella palauensis]
MIKKIKCIFMSLASITIFSNLNAQELDFTLAFEHPKAKQQRTYLGKWIHSLKAFDGLLYSGYGDWNANTGPISIYSYDLSHGTLREEFVMNTESIERFVVTGGQLCVPSIDPRGNPPHDVAMRTRHSSWDGVVLARFTHVFDIASLNGNDLWFIGSKGRNAVAMRSLDGGQTLHNADTLIVPPKRSENYARFFFGGSLNGKLYVQAVDNDSRRHRHSWVFDGNAWQPGPNLLPKRGDRGGRPVNFRGKLVYKGHFLSFEGRPLYSFDGRRVKEVLKRFGRSYARAADVKRDGNDLYVLVIRDEAEILRTRDLINWYHVATFPRALRPISMEVVNDNIYIGTAEAEVYHIFLTRTSYPQIR